MGEGKDNKNTLHRTRKGRGWSLEWRLPESFREGLGRMEEEDAAVGDEGAVMGRVGGEVG